MRNMAKIVLECKIDHMMTDYDTFGISSCFLCYFFQIGLIYGLALQSMKVKKILSHIITN